MTIWNMQKQKQKNPGKTILYIQVSAPASTSCCLELKLTPLDWTNSHSSQTYLEQLETQVVYWKKCENKFC